MSSKFMASSIEDLISDPNKYGAPTFEQFRKNPEKYRKSKEALMSTADGGSKFINGIKKHTYYMCGVKCDSLEHAQSVMQDMGLTEKDLEMAIDLEDMKNGEVRPHVKFRRKSNLILPEGM